MSYTIVLEKYSGPASRFTCPACHKPKKFTRYIDLLTKQYVNESVGICDRVDSCGYHYAPKEYYRDNDIRLSDTERLERVQAAKTMIAPEPELPSYIDYNKVIHTMDIDTPNSLERFIRSVYGDRVDAIIDDYRLGSYQYWRECNPIYWQIDRAGNVRTGKVMRYNPKTGKRVKDGPALHWYHALHKVDGFNMVQCLYGEHLLSYYPNKVVGIVESEKTALIASLEYDQLLWLATGGLSNISISKMSVLSDRVVILFPDVGAYDRWSSKADELSSVIDHISVSDLLEVSSSDKESGYDLADYILRG